MPVYDRNLKFVIQLFYMKDQPRKYDVLEKLIVSLQEMEHGELVKKGMKLIGHEILDDPDYVPDIKLSQPLAPEFLPTYTQDAFELGLILGGKRFIYWRQNRCHDNEAQIIYVQGGRMKVPIVEVDPDFMGQGGLVVINDVLNEEEIAQGAKYLGKFGEEPQVSPEQSRLAPA